MKSGLFFLCSLFAAIVSCTKPVAEVDYTQVPSVTFYTSLKDTLDVRTFSELNMPNVNGIKVRQAGLDVRYFDYFHADATALLGAIARSPFHRTSTLADTFARRISNNLLEGMVQNRSILTTYDQNFLNKIDASCEVYECIKSPLIHHLIVNRKTGKVYHRVTVEA